MPILHHHYLFSVQSQWHIVNYLYIHTHMRYAILLLHNNNFTCFSYSSESRLLCMYVPIYQTNSNNKHIIHQNSLEYNKTILYTYIENTLLMHIVLLTTILFYNIQLEMCTVQTYGLGKITSSPFIIIYTYILWSYFFLYPHILPLSCTMLYYMCVCKCVVPPWHEQRIVTANKEFEDKKKHTIESTVLARTPISIQMLSWCDARRERERESQHWHPYNPFWFTYCTIQYFYSHSFTIPSLKWL